MRGGRTISFLASGRLAVGLLTALVALLFLYLFLPQASRVGPGEVARWVEAAGIAGKSLHWAGLTDLRRSWLLFGTLGMLFVNLLLCMVRRFRPAATAWRMPRHVPDPSSDWPRRDVLGARATAAEVEALLHHRGFRTLVEGDQVYGVRGRFGVVGHWIFHVGILVLLLGGAYVVARPAPFRAAAGVGEGESFELRDSDLLSATGPVPERLPDLGFTVQEVDVVTDGVEARRFDVLLSPAGGGKINVGINRPYRAPPYQVLAHGFGYMPGWAILDGQGRMRRGAWVKLAPFPLEAAESFDLGPKLSTVQATFYPDHAREGAGHLSRSQELRHPRFLASVVWRGRTVHQGVLAPGERVSLLGEGEFLFLPEVRRYVLLEVIEERGHGIFFGGFGVMISGLLIRYGRIRKEIVVRLRPGSVAIFGRSEILESLFAEELERFVSELTERSFRLEARERYA